MRILIKGGNIVDPSSGVNRRGNILVDDGIIHSYPERTKTIEKDAETRVIDAAGKVVAPGFIDMHTNLGEPGYEHQETMRTGSMAAAAGGFTTVVCMPSTVPVNDNASVTEYILFKARTEAVVNVLPIGAITKGLEGAYIAEIGEMREAGCVGVTDAQYPVMDSRVMRLAMEYTKAFDIPVITDCQDVDLATGGVANEGYISTMLGLKGVPSASEEVMVSRNISLAELAGAKLHISHVSTKGAVRLIREAKQRGCNITAEAAPHHFGLTEQAVIGYDTMAKVSPPLRTEADVVALKEGLGDGTIDVIATSHSPHTEDEIKVEFDLAPFGISALETALQVSLQLVRDGVLTLPEMIEKFTVKPAQVLGIPKGSIRVGATADVVIFDEHELVTVDRATFLSKGKNTPFHGAELTGRVLWTIVGGEVVYSV
ncbi:MAG: dihydroorotase [Thermodesulfobacteriota bacterium]